MKSQAYRMALLYDFYGDVLTQRQKEFYDLYYNEDLSLAEIAENYGITPAGVRDVIVRAEAILTDLEDKTGLIKRFHAMHKQFQEMEAAAQEILEAVNAFVVANGLPVVEYFGMDVQTAITEKLPLNVAADDLVLREFFALPLNAMAAAYDPAYGDIIVQMEFPVDFEEGDVVVPVLGILDPATDVVTWIALDAVVNADGFVEITFTEDVFAQIAADSITMLAILA